MKDALIRHHQQLPMTSAQHQLILRAASRDLRNRNITIECITPHDILPGVKQCG